MRKLISVTSIVLLIAAPAFAQSSMRFVGDIGHVAFRKIAVEHQRREIAAIDRLMVAVVVKGERLRAALQVFPDKPDIDQIDPGRCGKAGMPISP